ncbi:hypothetical protein GQ44DRAFT_639726 [Phaeosphaeriaceae sp. PMI808]|nr:hypothetical protein GQ44DRAFT_639726 [Phaeosphaeriaceae sp. PMI808]
MRRSSSASSVSSAPTLVRQHRSVRWLESIGSGFTLFWRLPGIKHLIWPFQWFDRSLSRLMAKSKYRGWRMGIILGSCMSSIVLGINITILVVGAKTNGGFKNGFAVPVAGLAEEVSRWSSALHILINALSTLLLAASNYTMQVLSSPTRKDIDKAHAKREYFDIGVLSTRNLSRIPRRRLLLFILMALSSIPIHLFYNSAVFYIGANNEYDVYVVQVDSAEYKNIYAQSNMASVKNAHVYDHFEGGRWKRIYDTKLVSYGNLVLAVNEYRSSIQPDTFDGRPINPSKEMTIEWERGNVTWNLPAMLKHELGTQDFVNNITDTTSIWWIRMDWLINQSSGNKSTTNPPKFAFVPHVFTERLQTASRIQLSLMFLIIVIVCNSAKLLAMLWIVFMEQKDYIVTLGDGVSSFLERPDPTTERMCILSKSEIIHEVADTPLKAKHDDQLARLVTQSGKTWTKPYCMYSNALNRDREIGSNFIFIVVGTLLMLFIIITSFSGHASMKWGTASDTTFHEADSSPQQTLLNAWIANAAQLVLSFCYLAINSECTAMAGAAEWNNLATSHKGLRVTKPVGQQRDTYFLQLPYRWSLPLTIVSGGLHWLLSQSVFLVRIDTYNREGNLIKSAASKSACGFAATSWLTMTICFWLLVGTVGLIGRKKMKVKIPFAAGCSLVISAACHPLKDDMEPHLQLVRWGVVEGRMFEDAMHCSLSARSVTKPKVGTKYL